MSFASRLWRCLPLVAAVLMTPASNAATACPEPGSTAWKKTFGAASHVRVLALSGSCAADCAHLQPDAAKGPEREAQAPLPLSIVTHAEDVADWHADIFERLRGEHFEDGHVRYCGIARLTPVRPL